MGALFKNNLYPWFWFGFPALLDTELPSGDEHEWDPWVPCMRGVSPVVGLTQVSTRGGHSQGLLCP